MAVKRGWTLNEYSLSHAKTENVIASKTEEDIYAALDLPCLPPEMREDRGEFELKAAPPDLITLDDIRGDLHMHTVASDGRGSIEQMAKAAALGYEYICITDHSQSSVIANGLKPERLREHMAEVRRVARTIKGITVWAGAEVDIHGDGSLDYDDELTGRTRLGGRLDAHRRLERYRHQHTRHHCDAESLRKRARPSDRPPARTAMPGRSTLRPWRAAAQTGTALEINASTYRLDLRDQRPPRPRRRGDALH